MDADVKTQLDRLERKVDTILRRVGEILLTEDTMSVELDNLEKQVRQNSDLETSAVTLIKGLADQLAAAKDDPTKIVALTNELKTKADALAAAITANTTPPPTP